MEFEEIIIWSKIPKDTKVLVSQDGEDWARRYFAFYENDKFNCFGDGTTSWNYLDTVSWEYCKLAEEE